MENLTKENKPEKKTGLGRGLAALLGDDEAPSNQKANANEAHTVRETFHGGIKENNVPAPTVNNVTGAAESIENKGSEFASKTHSILNIPIESIHANPEQPRRNFSDDELLELAESISEQGLIQPIVVRIMPDQTYQIVAGERRWRASKIAGLIEIPAILRSQDDQVERDELASVIENIQRVDLNAIELSNAYSKIIQTYGFTQDQLSKKLGVSRVSVANTLRLQKLPTGVQEAVVHGKLSEGHARALLGLENDADISAIAEQAISKNLNVREVESIVKEKTQPVSTQSKIQQSLGEFIKDPSPKSPAVLASEEELRNTFGTKVVVRGNTKGGTIELYYSNEESLHRLLHQLRSVSK